MADPLASWHDEHANFAQLLDLLEIQANAFHGGAPPNYELMSDIVEYLRAFGDRVHHRREDAAFDCLLARDPDLAPAIRRLLQEHRVIAAAGEQLAERIDEAVDDVMFPREALEAAAATYLVYYRNHLVTEERRIIPRAAQLLTPEDWAAVALAVPRMPDPVFGGAVEARFAELRAKIERERVASMAR